MKFLRLLVILIALFNCYGCKKELTTVSKNESNKPFIDSALTFLKSQIDKEEFENLDLKKLTPLIYHNSNVGLKVFEKDDSMNNFILLYKQDETFIGNRITINGRESLISKEHYGTIKLEAFDKKSSAQLIVKQNKVAKIITSNESGSEAFLEPFINLYNRSQQTTSAARNMKYELPEVVVTVYIGSDVYDYWSLYWLLSSGGGSGGGSGGSYSSSGVSGSDGLYVHGGGYSSNKPTGESVAAIPKFLPPETPIKDLKQELKCFTVNPFSSFTISVNANQAWPNSRDKVDPSAAFMVGHTFLTLQQSNVDGSKITRTVGFYPKTSAKPGSSVDQSIFGDDTYTNFAVSLQISVSGSELNTVINALIDQQSKNFELNNFNCTNSALEALRAIDINLPSTKSGDAILFKGNNPADLGQDIRELDLEKFSSSNGNRKVTRIVSNNNDKTPEARVGTCFNKI